MTQTIKHRAAAVIPLTETINVHTDLSPEHIPALRAGFALYPSNPRWNIFKFRAWRLGRQWRYALQAGEMEVCPSNRLLVRAAHNRQPEEEPSDRRFSPKTLLLA
ncbi:hypothetical protein [Roseofilum sp. Guam]|uniref:hypothetical protein n=1 Tax=Roseofilum sp. Guam TaxID=2821502 RepID=UPI001B264EB3|nr:hypothetical protein [Roseofilum sp. Guam]MBP0030585.1 hypothetical protein [Roseofilum sp. Guam]